MKLKFVLLLLPLLSNLAGAATAAAAAPAVAATAEVFVVMPEDGAKPASGIVIDTPKMPMEKKIVHDSGPIRVWSGPVPLSGVMFFIVASMPVLASLYFAFQLFLFIQARRRRLSTQHQREQ
ncbi:MULTISPECIES: hypothetical protein [unclassified Undibacterium]|uniref:hypothetical protein n=1 Tax=unclassified Undibacterium TaxID=2630295 RepID=UPI002AC930F4|nr:MULTISPECIES: hypothetical protein [unclassified Undibacterium]MEB0137830.1 hypothetical protein [Undibacterium sp. CCC2.1]MEB0170979.1 hypothetical protein [Undibacterium sp. CCC1.1]MEB0175024.1 hypothetical protein [Undibacterium sp. CCC3.4]MEB0215770.1 hypothetical protein [Undibacterium sp. 5I2]WPX44830.1 hypothetical protein RHM61_06265 [Undibacterium sp. CCC3.4]